MHGALICRGNQPDCRDGLVEELELDGAWNAMTVISLEATANRERSLEQQPRHRSNSRGSRRPTAHPTQCLQILQNEPILVAFDQSRTLPARHHANRGFFSRAHERRQFLPR